MKKTRLPDVAFGLSAEDFAALVRAMSAVVRKVGCPDHVHPLEVVHDAFVTALCKPISERPAVTNQKRFTSWMCALAKAAALTNRKSKHRRLLSGNSTEAQLEALAAVGGFGDALAAREAVCRALEVLSAEDRALIFARHIEGKTIAEISREQKPRWNTIDRRYRRAMSLLRDALRGLLAALVLLLPKNVRAQSIDWSARVLRVFAPLSQPTCAIAVAVVCGASMPANAPAAIKLDHATITSPSTPTMMAFASPTQPEEPASPNSFLTPTNADPSPDKLADVDHAPVQWSADEMKSKLIGRLLQTTAVPFAFLVAPAAVELGCAGSTPSTAAPSSPEDDEEITTSHDQYEQLCENEHRRGNDCPSREEFYGRMGRCSNGNPKPDCTKY